MPPTTVKVEHVNPFVTSTMETFSKMIGMEAKPGKLQLKKGSGQDYDITGIIGLSGGAKGMVSLSFPKSSAIAITNKFVGLDCKDITPDVVDAIGELANIVAGYAKRGLSEFNISISLPSVITGSGHQVKESKDVFAFVVPFETSAGPFHLAVSLKSVDA